MFVNDYSAVKEDQKAYEPKDTNLSKQSTASSIAVHF